MQGILFLVRNPDTGVSSESLQGASTRSVTLDVTAVQLIYTVVFRTFFGVCAGSGEGGGGG